MSAPDLGFGYDRADTEDTTVRPVPAGVTGYPVGTRHPEGTVTVPGLDCGHLPGEPHDDACDYWRGVALGEYPSPNGMPGPYGLPGPVARPPFDLRGLREAHITAADLERGAA